MRKLDIELPALPTTVIGSYPRPRWLRHMIKQWSMGRVDDKALDEAFRDAVRVVVREQEEVGVDIPSDGEMWRDEMVEYFAARIDGFRFYGPVRVWGNNFFNKPAVVSKLSYREPIVLKEYMFLRSVSTRRVVKVTITGPYTIADWSFNEHYRSKEELTFELAKIINREIVELEKAGALFVQIDEPALTTHPEDMDWAVDAINQTTRGISIKLGLHVCYSDYNLLSRYFDKLNFSQFALEFANRDHRDLDVLSRLGDREVGLGVIDVHNRSIEDPQQVSRAIEKAMKYVEPGKIYINPDCGLKLLPRDLARKKLEVMVTGAHIARRELLSIGITATRLRG